MTIEFHSQAASRFNELAQELRTRAKAYALPRERREAKTLIYPMAQLSDNDVIGVVDWKQRSVNGYGEETGRYWEASSGTIGYEGDDYVAVENLAQRLAEAGPLKNRVSERFLLDALFAWLQEMLNAEEATAFTDFIARRASSAIAVHETWIPIHRTYSSKDIAMGGVNFKTITPEMLERWYSRIPAEERKNAPGADVALTRQRSMLQATLAACTVTEAEPIKAAEIAQSATDEAVAMLRFMSEVSWTCRITSHVLPIGKENIHTTMDINVENGSIKSIRKGVIERGPSGWNVDSARMSPMNGGVLELLQDLASQRDASEFRTNVYGALQLHARASIATEVSHKLVFVVAAAESIFLRNASEPIQKNLGERMAFLIGQSVDERRKVIKNVDEFYGIRSGLIHHGKEVQDHQKDIVDEFFVNVWFSFVVLMRSASKWKTRDEMFSALEERKLA
jgi:Apea-like HEPN